MNIRTGVVSADEKLAFLKEAKRTFEALAGEGANEVDQQLAIIDSIIADVRAMNVQIIAPVEELPLYAQ